MGLPALNKNTKKNFLYGIQGLTRKSQPSVLNNKRRTRLLTQKNSKRVGNLTNKNNKRRNTAFRRERQLKVKKNDIAVRTTRRNKRNNNKNKLQTKEFRERNKNTMEARIRELEKMTKNAKDEKQRIKEEKRKRFLEKSQPQVQPQDKEEEEEKVQSQGSTEIKNHNPVNRRRNKGQLIEQKAKIKNEISKIITKIQQQTELMKSRNYTKLSSNDLDSNSRKLEELQKNVTEAKRLAKPYDGDGEIDNMLYNITTRYNIAKEKIQQSKNSQLGSKGYVKRTGNLFKK